MQTQLPRQVQSHQTMANANERQEVTDQIWCLTRQTCLSIA